MESLKQRFKHHDGSRTDIQIDLVGQHQRWIVVLRETNVNEAGISRTHIVKLRAECLDWVCDSLDMVSDHLETEKKI